MRLFKDYLKLLSSKVFTPSRSLKEWEAKNFRLQKVKLPNTKLTKDLEKLCLKKGGVLTFGEFISEEMFGKNGYYKAHRDFGKTQVDKVWPETIINLCQKNSITSVVEVGSGDGSLGKETLKIARKSDFALNWTGIEINESLWNRLQKNKPDNFFLLKSAQNLKPQRNLTIFPYSLDSMPSEVIVNNTSEKGVANTMLGIKIDNEILEEVFLSESDLKQRGILFENGVFKTKGYSFDFSPWVLHPNQRAYLPIEGFLAIIDYVQKMKKSSTLLIIDEMKLPPSSLQTYHLGTPRILNSPIRDYNTLTEAYKNTGDNLWYFPMYFNPLLEFLKELGFSDVKFDIEERMAANIQRKQWNKPGLHFCFSIIARLSKVSLRESFNIPFPS